jgi:hypothetical protein
VDLKYCVSTNKHYSKKTLPIIVDSLLKSGISRNQIFIFEGGNQQSSQTKYNAITLIKSRYSSFELTALIEIVNKQITSDYWFLLQDTCKVGSNFKKLLENNINEIVTPNKAKKLSLKPTPSMNIGIYQYDYLIKHADKIMAFANTDNSKSALNELKYKIILEEDFLFDLDDEKNYVCIDSDQPAQILENEPNLIFKIPRITEYYAHLDLYKFKANHGQTNIDEGFHISL